MRRLAAGAAPGAVPGPIVLRVLSVEVVQSVQDLDHGVRLIAGKATVVRVYVEPSPPGLPASVRVGGELVWRRTAGAPFAFLPSLGTVRASARARASRPSPHAGTTPAPA